MRKEFYLITWMIVVLTLSGCNSIAAHIMEFSRCADFSPYPSIHYLFSTEWTDDLVKNERAWNPPFTWAFPLPNVLDLMLDTAFLPVDCLGSIMFKPKEMSIDNEGRIVMPSRRGDCSEVSPNELNDAIELSVEPVSGGFAILGRLFGPSMYRIDTVWYVNTNGVFSINICRDFKDFDYISYDTVAYRSVDGPITLCLCPPCPRYFSSAYRIVALQSGQRRILTKDPWNRSDRFSTVPQIMDLYTRKANLFEFGAVSPRSDNFVGKVTARRRNGEVICSWSFSKDKLRIRRSGSSDIVRNRYPWIESDFLKGLNDMCNKDYKERYFRVEK